MRSRGSAQAAVSNTKAKISRYLELPIGQALAMVERGEIVDGKTIMLLQYAQLNLFDA